MHACTPQWRAPGLSMGQGARSSRHSWICQCIEINILELKQTFDDILPLKNFMFKSYRVDKQTNKQTNKHTHERTLLKTIPPRYAVAAWVVKNREVCKMENSIKQFV